MLRVLGRTVIGLLFMIQFTGCKKYPGVEMWEFSFTYDGKTYNNSEYGSPVEYQGDIVGIEIRKPDVLGGVVRFEWTNNCAFLEPTGMEIFFNYNTCTFFTATSVDSSKIFTYASGSASTTASGCKTRHDPFNGVDYTVCTVSGSFSLVLVNNAGITRSITGSFKDPDVIQ
jgi:hypothetical protein